MHLVAALAAGIRGAESGTATIYKRGTSTPASWYTDAEASGSSSTAVVQLDEHGGATVYVDEYVTIVAADSGGSVIRSWTEMCSASDVEVRSQSMTGTDYTTGTAAAGNPVALSSVMDKWYASAGTTAAGAKARDFKVIVSDTMMTLEAAFGPTAAIWFNVQDPTYGATGDGTTDDTAAVTAAITAANAVGGIVYFPPGTYRITSVISPTDASLVGAGPAGTSIKYDAASGNGIAFGASSSRVRMSGLAMWAAQTTTGSLLTVGAATTLDVIDCDFDGENCDSIYWTSTSTAATITFTRCIFRPGANQDCIESSAHTGRLVCIGCRFIAPATHNPSDAMVYGTRIDLRECTFELAAATSGTIACFKSSSTKLDSSVHGCKFISSGGATVTGITLGAIATGSVFSETGNVMPGYLDTTFTAYSYSETLLISTTVEAQVHLGTRDSRYIVISHASTGTVTLSEIQQYGHLVVNNTSGGSVTYNLGLNGATPPPGSVVRLVVKADGSGLTALDITGTLGANSSHAVTSGNRSNYTVVYGVNYNVLAFNQNY